MPKISGKGMALPSIYFCLIKLKLLFESLNLKNLRLEALTNGVELFENKPQVDN